MSSNLSPALGCSISVTSTTSNVQIAASVDPRLVLRICNGGTKTAFYGLGDANVAAVVPNGTLTPNCFALCAGDSIYLSVEDNTYLAAICGGTDTTVLYLSLGREVD